MNKPEHLLACLAEECAEVAKECGKALRFGLTDRVTKDPHGPRGTEGPTNAEKIASELGDLFAVAEMLTASGYFPGPWFSTAKVDEKKRKVVAYMEYAQRVGALTATADELEGAEKVEAVPREKVEKLVEALTYILPLAKGYAAQNLAIASNARMIATAEDAIADFRTTDAKTL